MKKKIKGKSFSHILDKIASLSKKVTFQGHLGKFWAQNQDRKLPKI